MFSGLNMNRLGGGTNKVLGNDNNKVGGGKRKAEVSPRKMEPTKKRSALGDLTNVRKLVWLMH